MKYMVLMYADPEATAAMTEEERADVFRRHEELHRDLADTGELLNGAGLTFPHEAVILRWNGTNRPTGGTGPLYEAPEHVTAYYVLECESPERAQAIAERVLDFHVVAVEVRGIHDTFGMD